MRDRPKKMPRHGMSYSPTYKSWGSMMERCYNPNASGYDRYGAVGIKVCERWHRFVNFYEDMGEKPPEKTIDKINNKYGYEPSNCRWATRKEQAMNRSTTRILEYNGKKYLANELRCSLGMKWSTFWNRINRGWPMEEVVNRPVAHKGV